MPATISRASYAAMFGPTTGDKVRLADTELFIEVEQDFTIYGEEVKFGGGKVIPDGMGQSQQGQGQGSGQARTGDGAGVGHDPTLADDPTRMRGSHRSRAQSDIVAEARQLIAQGVQARAAAGAMGGQDFGNLDDEILELAQVGLQHI